MTAQWQLEELQLRGCKAFINGWCFVPGKEILELEIQLRDESNRFVGSFPLQSTTLRPDVQQAFKMENTALHSGFVGIGAWPRQPRLRDQLVITGLVENKELLEIRIPHSRLQEVLAPSRWQRRKSACLVWLRYLGRAIHLLANGQLRILIEKLKRQLNGSPQKQMPEVLSWDTLQRLGGKPTADIHLIVDHRLGGGANQYSERLVTSWLQSGATVLILSYHLAKLQPMLTVRTSQQELRLGLADERNLLATLQFISITTITYNTAVSFVEGEAVPELLLSLRQTHRSHLTVLVHDFFSVCPSHFLIHADGFFCGIPNLKTCNDCLHRNPHGFTSLFKGDISQWRESWGPLLKDADEIVAFSNNSIDLLRQAYETWQGGRNWLQGREITLRPHTVDYLRHSPLTISQHENIVIGIVGQIGFHKGAQVVRNLTQEILRQNSREKIVIIGSLEGKVDGRVTTQTGRYNNRDLPSIIAESSVNLILFPSIWPETFSYVTQEIIQCGLPLACFELGAPAERVREYEKGLLLKSQDAKSILQELRNLFQATYPK